MDPEQPAAAAGHQHRVKLTPFWVKNPASWFAAAEGQFHLNNVTEELSKYYHVLNALPEDTVDLVADLVEGELPGDPYTQLKRRLFAAHTLTDYQKVEQLNALPPLGSQKPSELLASIMKLCPRGTESSVYLTFIFLHRLPRELRVLLSEVDHADRRALAEKADHLWSHNTQGHHAVAAVLADEDNVNAVRRVPPRAAGARGGVPSGGKGGAKTGKNLGGRATVAMSAADQAAMQASGLCWYHWSYAENAKSCREPCSWSGN